MATADKLPFSWHSVESLPDLERLRLVLDTLPDERWWLRLRSVGAADATTTR